MSVTAGQDEGEGRARRRRRWPRVAAVAVMLIGIVLAGLWFARKPLAARYADRFLATKHVPAHYRIVDLGLGRQRLVDVVIGDPADPDLVADWLETDTAIGWNGPYLTGVRAGRLRARARWADGRLSFGSVDRLLPSGGGKPAALPALALDVADARLRVETRWGVAGAKLRGRGRLDGGFAGRLAVSAAALGTDDCRVIAPAGVWDVDTAGRGPFRAARLRLQGSTQAAGFACAGARTGFANANGTAALVFGDRFGWSLTQDVAVTDPRHPRAAARTVSGRVAVQGGAGLAGTVALTARDVAGAGLGAATLALDGRVARDTGQGALAFDGEVRWTAARAAALIPPRLADAARGTPAGPLLARALNAAARAALRFDGRASLHVAVAPWGTTVRVATAALHAASGAQARLADGAGAVWSPRDGLKLDGAVQLGGGGLPATTLRFDRAARGAFSGTATLAPYAAGDARLALAPLRFAVAGAVGRLVGQATLSGPLGAGRVDGLTAPIDLRWRGRDLTLAPGCTPVRWTRLAVGGLVLDPATLRLCPTGTALLRVAGGRAEGGARLGATWLTGRIGSTPLTLAAAGARLDLADLGFSLAGVAVRLGRPERVTRIDAATLAGRVEADGVAGRFAGAGGQIGAVPLLLSGAAGDWRLRGGVLALGGALTVSDAQTDRPRFRPLPLRDVALTLAGNRIDAHGRVIAPNASARLIAEVALRHDLARGTGDARFTVPGLVFDRALQPDQLTPVTFGVIADVRGVVTGEGAIGWSPAGVTSTGRFHTDNTALAAAFGPVEGIAGTIRFTDLLQLESAPDQVLTVRSINPGIAVTDGTVTFRTLPGSRVAVAGARWPFAGGTLTLAPTLLDFGQASERRLVFRVDGAAADRFLQQFDFKNLDATGIFDGVLPMVFDQSGGRIENGRLAVRPGGGTIAYVGPISQKDVGFWGNLAFQALKSLRYRSLAIVMNGPLAGEMVTEVRFAGVSQGEGAARGGITGFLVRRLQRLPFVFNIRIQAPFRGLLDATASFYDPRRLIRRNLPQLIEEQNRRAPPPPAPPIQPPASEIVP